MKMKKKRRDAEAMRNTTEIMKIFFLPILSFCVLSTSLSAFTYGTADESILVSYTIAFPQPVIEKVTIGERIFDTVKVDELPEVGEYGKPVLPVKELRILIPYGYTVISIDANPSELISLGSGYVLKPGSRDVPLIGTENTPLPPPDDEMYQFSGMSPGNLFDVIGTYGFRGYQILYMTLNPVHYTSVTGKLSYYSDMTITLKLDKVSKVAIHDLFRDSDGDKNQLKDKVDTFEESMQYPSMERQTLDDYDLLIITTDALKTSFEPLAKYHTSQGVPTLITTLSEIGSTDPEAIRSYIRTAYLNLNIEYVLLGGDSDIVPARMLWVSSGYGETTQMPSDLYYGCLDGTYNFDGDEYWGEPTDGDNGGDVDLVAEVYVGRACVGDSDEADNFIHKTVSYVYTVDPYQSKVLMVGEYLWGGPDTWGGDYMDELINGSSANGYNTTGIPSDEYTIDKLYDRDWPGHDWPKEEIINRINDNVHIINHLGHSAYNYNMKMESSDADALTNTRYFFAYSQGCDNGGFDNPFGTDCIAEHFTVKTDHGAFAVIANARYGWGETGGTDGANQCYHREFIDAIFGEGIIQLGRANQDSKEDNLYKIHLKVMRWCYYEINLLGDPTIDFFTHYNNSVPGTPQAPAGQTNGEVGVEYNYTIHANTDPEGDVTYYKFYWGDGKSSQWLGPCNPSETVSAQHTWDTAGMYDVVVKCRDDFWGMSNFSESLPVEITGPFFEIGRISGGLFKASAVIKNSGVGAATNVKRSITVEGVYNKKIFFVTNSTIDFLDSGETTLAQTDKPILGFGKVKITAAAYSPGGEKFSKTVDGYVFLCLVLVLK
jgi:hypothetical protein